MDNTTFATINTFCALTRPHRSLVNLVALIQIIQQVFFIWSSTIDEDQSKLIAIYSALHADLNCTTKEHAYAHIFASLIRYVARMMATRIFLLHFPDSKVR